MKKKIALLISLSFVLLLSGCARGDGGGGFDILGILNNPIVMIIGVFIIVYYMMKKGK